MLTQQKCFDLQRQIEERITALDDSDERTHDTLTRDYGPYLSTNCQFIKTEDTLTIDDKLKLLQSLFNNTISSKNAKKDDLPYGFEEIYTALNYPPVNCLKLPRFKKNSSVIWIAHQNVTPLIHYYAKTQILKEILDLVYDAAGKPILSCLPGEKAHPTYAWLDQSFIMLQQQFVDFKTKMALSGNPQGLLDLRKSKEHLSRTWISFLRQFALGRLLLGQPRDDLPSIENRDLISRISFWFFYSFNVWACTTLSQACFRYLKNNLIDCRELISEIRPLSHLPKIAIKTTISILIVLNLPIILIGIVLLGATSLPTNFLRMLIYQFRLNYSFLKLLDCLDAIKDAVLISGLVVPGILLTVKVLPTLGILLDTVGYLGSTALAYLFVNARSLFLRQHHLEVISTSTALQALITFPIQILLATSFSVALGRKLHQGYDTILNYLQGPPLLSESQRNHRIQRITEWASMPHLSDQERADISKCLYGLRFRRPAREIIDLSEKILENIEPQELITRILLTAILDAINEQQPQLLNLFNALTGSEQLHFQLIPADNEEENILDNGDHNNSPSLGY